METSRINQVDSRQKAINPQMRTFLAYPWHTKIKSHAQVIMDFSAGTCDSTKLPILVVQPFQNLVLTS